MFVDELDLKSLGFDGMEPEETGRPAYHPATLLKLYIYGYLNRIQSSRRLERETQRNVELVWLTGRLSPDFKTIADFRKDNGPAIRRICSQFIALCRRLKLFTETLVAIDSSKFKAVNNSDRAFTEGKVRGRLQQLEVSIGRYLEELDRADRMPSLVSEQRTTHIKIAARSESVGLEDPTTDRRASLRNPQGVDGIDPFPHSNPTARQYRDESACAGIQHETIAADLWNAATDANDEDLTKAADPPTISYSRASNAIGTLSSAVT